MSINVNSSFGLIRTNPRLTTNVKISITSEDILYLDSIDARPELNDVKYKNFKLNPLRSYEYDLFRFWDGGTTPENLTFFQQERTDSLRVRQDYVDQYDDFYWYGVRALRSEFYDEEFEFFAPMWIDQRIPDYFVIFRVEDPSSFNLNQEDINNIVGLNDPKLLREQILNNATIIKSISMQEDSNIGRYLRNYRGSSDFPPAPIEISWSRDKFSFYNGINLKSGGFIQRAEDTYNDFNVIDKTVIEYDHFVSTGWRRNNLAFPNILNLSFLFDDVESADYDINRYFGLYVDAFDYADMVVSEVANDAANQSIITVDPTTYETKNGLTVPVVTDIQQDNSIFYVKDANDNIHNIDQVKTTVQDQFITKKTGLTLEDFTGFEQEFSTTAQITQGLGRPYIQFIISDNPINGDFYTIGTDAPENRIFASSGLNATEVNGQNFSTRGTVAQVARAMARAINNIPNIEFQAVAEEDTVTCISNFGGAVFNQILFISRKPGVLNNPVRLIQGEGNGWLGATTNSERRVAIPREYEDEVTSKIGSLLTTGENGLVRVSNVFRYLDEPITPGNDGVITGFRNADNLIVLEFDGAYRITTSGRLTFFTQNKVQLGRLAIYGLKDFDTDTFSTEYGYELDEELFDRYYAPSQNYGNPNHAQDVQDNFQGFISLWDVEDQVTGDLSTIRSEYDRLQENFIKELVIEGRVNPYILKWVKEGKNVRELEYRLNSNEAFGVLNFSPSFQLQDTNSQYYTHEWYYMSQYPHYFNLDGTNTFQVDPALVNGEPVLTPIPETNSGIPTTLDEEFEFKRSSFQFFDDPIDEELLLDINSDYFTEYFTVDKIRLSDDSFRNIKTQLRFGVLENGNDIRFPSSFFRGVRVLIKDRKESEIDVNFNLDRIDFVRSSRLNNYKFSAVLLPDYELTFTGDFEVEFTDLFQSKLPFQIIFVKNEKFKTVTCIIKYKAYDAFINQGDLVTPDIKFTKVFEPDPVLLYSVRNLTFQGQTLDVNLSGTVDLSINNLSSFDTGLNTWFIRGVLNNVEIPTSFIDELNVNPQGSFNTILCILPVENVVVAAITGISEIVSNDLLLASTVYYNAAGVTFDPNEIVTSGRNSSSFWRGLRFVYVTGGFNLLTQTIQNLSFGRIADLVNSGDPSVAYRTVKSDGTRVDNDFIIEFEDPIDFIKSSFLDKEFDGDNPPSLSVNDNIGYSLTLKNKTEFKPLFRYDGFYIPKFVDLLKFIDPIDFLEQEQQLNLYMDLDDPDFGLLKNQYYAKVNPESPNLILRVQPNTGFQSVYPLINEIAIQPKDFYIFKSNWDPDFYQKSNNFEQIESRPGTEGVRDVNSFLGTKLQIIPDGLQIQTFTSINVNDIDPVDIQSDENHVVWSRDNRTIRLDTYLEKRIIDQLLEDGADQKIREFVNPNFILQNSVDEFVREYFRYNILPRFRVEQIQFWVRESNQTLNLIETEIDNANKIQQGFTTRRDYRVNFIRNSRFDFELIYNLNTAKFLNFSVGLSANIVKK